MCEKQENKTGMQGTLLWRRIWDVGTEKVRMAVKQYLYLMFAVFPLYTTNQYFHILWDRYHFFWIITAILTGIVFLIRLWYSIYYIKECKNEFLSLNQWKDIFKSDGALPWNFTMTDGFLLAFLMTAMLSNIGSVWPKEAFWGTEGRYQGIFLWFWYGAAYFMVSRYAELNFVGISLFLGVGAILSLWGITDFYGFDMLGWIGEIHEGQRGMFTSCIGNINTFTAMVSFYMAMAGVLAVFCMIEAKKGYGKQLKRFFLYDLLFLLFIMALTTGRSDNAVLGIMVFFLISPFLFWDRVQGVFGMGLLMEMAIGGILLITKIPNHNPYINLQGSILFRILPSLYVRIFCIIMLILFFLYCYYQKAKKSDLDFQKAVIALKSMKQIWLLIIITSTLAGLFFFYDANFAGHAGRYGDLAKWLVISDSWGSHRGMIWRMGIEEFQKFSWFQKFFGTGLETFGMVMKEKRWDEMQQISRQIFDSPHNELLQYLFTTGICGFLAYYGFLVTGSLKGFISKEPMRMGAAMAVIVYTSVSFVNISVPITQPFVILFVAFAAQSKEVMDK